MMLNDKKFWILWLLMCVAIVTSCAYDIIKVCNFEDALYVFIACLPLIIILPLFQKRHKFGAVINATVACIYSVLLCYIRLSCKPLSNWDLYWLVFLITLAAVQFTILVVYWGIERFIKVCKCKSTKDSVD